jgi:hypothetical protein
MSDQPKVEHLTPPQTEEALSREWLIADDDARRLYSEMLGTGQKRTSTSALPKEGEPAPPKPPTSASKRETSLAVRASQSKAPAEEQKGTPAKFAFRVFVALALAVLLYAAYLYTHPPQKASRSRANAAGEASAAAPASVTNAPGVALGQQTISLTPTLSVVECEPGRSATQTLTIANETPSELTFEVVARDLLVRDGKAVFLPAGAALNGIAATAVFSEKYFNVKPHQTTTVSIEFIVHPQTTARGMLILLQGTDKVAFGKTTMTANLGAVITINAPESTTTGLDGGGAGTSAGTASYAISQWMSDASASSLAGQQAMPEAAGEDSARRQGSPSGPGLGGQQP